MGAVRTLPTQHPTAPSERGSHVKSIPLPLLHPLPFFSALFLQPLPAPLIFTTIDHVIKDAFVRHPRSTVRKFLQWANETNNFVSVLCLAPSHSFRHYSRYLLMTTGVVYSTSVPPGSPVRSTPWHLCRCMPVVLLPRFLLVGFFCKLSDHMLTWWPGMTVTRTHEMWSDLCEQQKRLPQI